MIFLLFNFWSTSLLFVLDHLRLKKVSQWVLLVLVFFIVMMLPAMQYGVGYDYFNYVEVFVNSDRLDVYARKNEYGFYYLVLLLRELGLPPQSFFIVASALMSASLVYCLQLLRGHGFKMAIIFVCFFLMTGMLHNQMNGIRNYIAAYFFLSALLSKFSGRYWFSVFFVLMGVFFHQTFYVALVFVLLPCFIYEYLAKRVFLFYFILLVFWVSGMSVSILEFLLKNYLSFYSHYSGSLNVGSSVVNVLTKAYYLPLQVWFVFWVINNFKKLSLFEVRVVGVWVLSSSLYLSLLHTDLFYRAYHYFVFFSVFPAYYFLRSSYSTIFKVSFLMYLVAPYLLKVMVFPEGEYQYSSIVFGGLF